MIYARGIQTDGADLSIFDQPFCRIGVETRKMKVLSRLLAMLVSAKILLFIGPVSFETSLEQDDAPFRHLAIRRFPILDVVDGDQVITIPGDLVRDVDLYSGRDQLRRLE